MTESTFRYVQSVHVFTADGLWHKPARLVHVRLILAGAGAGGYGPPGWIDSASGGGGGAAVQSEWIRASELPDTVEVVVGGSARNTDGGDSRFLDFRAPGGTVGAQWNDPGRGGLAPWRGGDGGAPNQDGESMSLIPITMLAGGGGGAGSGGAWGGQSGGNFLIDGSQSGTAPLLMPGLLQCGPGGSIHQPATWPAGGGGAMQAGAAGVVTVIETTYVMED